MTPSRPGWASLKGFEPSSTVDPIRLFPAGAANKAAKAPPTWHQEKRTAKAMWRVRKGKHYFRAKYKAMIQDLAAKGQLDQFREEHRLTCKDWRSKLALQALDDFRRSKGSSASIG